MEVKPTPSGRSNTTTKLDQLTKRRRELEGDRYTVQRLTQVRVELFILAMITEFNIYKINSVMDT
jgi:hypothetical protein